MFIKSYFVKKNHENSILKLQNNLLAMGKEDASNDVFLSTADLKTGIIHNYTHILDQVEIHPQENSKYALKKQDTNKYYSSFSINNKYNYSYINQDRDKAAELEFFDLIPTDILTLKSFDFFRFMSHNAQDKRPINLFWWRGGQICNFGDELNPYVVSFLANRPINRSSVVDTDVLGIGSVLDAIPPRDKLYPIWGSGTLRATPLKKLYKPHLLRGPLTHSLFADAPKSLPYGDPGIICSRIWERSKEVKYEWGIIPHHSQRDKPWLKKICENTNNLTVIDVTNQDMKAIMQQASSCKRIASSSLHGLIIADSYQIPSVWLWEDMYEAGQWKFFDYFAGIGREKIDNINPNTLSNLNDIKIHSNTYKHFDRIDKICDSVIDSFPL